MGFIKISAVLFLLIQFSNISSGCPEGWKRFIDDHGFPDCFTCRKCPEGTTVVENCTKEHETICDECTGDEYYHILSMQCKTCTVCDAGNYVRRNCSTFKDTKCDVCPSGTFSLVQNSSTCTNCTKCNRTQVILQNCNNTADTTCGECTGDEYYHSISMRCKTCTVCDAGYYLRNNCSTFKDTECNVCPSGTFSLVQNSSTCTKCTDCRGTEKIRGCNGTADTVCEPNEEGKLQLVLLVVGIVISVVSLLSICVVCARRHWRKDGNGETHEDGNGETHEMLPSPRNSSCGAIVVNPNKQTDKRYQRSESSEFTLKPDKELRGTDKEQRMKSSTGELHERPSGHKVKATHVRNINVREKSDKEKCDVTGLVVISRDFMVVCDRNNSSVKLIDTKQNIVTSKIRLRSKPWDTALVPRDVTEEPTTYDLIVTLPGARKLRYVRVNGDQITDTNKVISVKGWCQGIQVTQDRKLAVSYGGLLNPGKVEILDMDGQVLRRLETYHDGDQLFHQPHYLAVSPGSGILYVSDEGNSTLTSISSRDWSVMTKLEGLVNPQGVTVDRAGSVFVCCWYGTVHLVAATGDRSTEILGEEDGLCWSPLAIGLSPEGDRMYVGGCDSDHVQEFQLTEN